MATMGRVRRVTSAVQSGRARPAPLLSTLLRTFAPLFALAVLVLPVAAVVVLVGSGAPTEVVGRGPAGAPVALPQGTQVRVVGRLDPASPPADCTVAGSQRTVFSGRLSRRDVDVDGERLSEVGSVGPTREQGATLTCEGISGDVLLLAGANGPPAVAVLGGALVVTLISAAFAAVGFSLRRRERGRT